MTRDEDLLNSELAVTDLLEGGRRGVEVEGPPYLLDLEGGHRFDFDSRDGLLLGRSKDCEIQMDVSGLSREHARFTVVAGAVSVQDLGSTNGTFVNGNKVDSAELLERDLIEAGPVVLELLFDGSLRSRHLEKLRREGLRDGLTGAHNRRFFDEAIEREISRAVRSGDPLSLVMIDVDRFKQVNDRFGHPVGDRVICRVVDVLHAESRSGDLVCRFGGDEMAVLLPSTAADRAAEWAERVSERLRTESIPVADESLTLTLSVGVASIEKLGSSERLIEAADQALYAAKRDGRDRVVTAPA